jgi:hypothetical protein
MADDPKISQRYRELSREEPPRHLDDAILAASRRAVAGKKRQSWYVPLAAAAIVVLAVAVTVHVERERPDEEGALSQATPPPPPAPGPAEQKALVPDPKPAPAQDATEALAKRRDAPASAPAAPPPRLEAQRQAQDQAAESRASAAAPLMREERVRAAREEGGIPGSAGPLPTLARASPEQLLQGIADLRRQGRHEDADRALAEFRRLHPGYRMSEEMRAKVEREPARAR